MRPIDESDAARSQVAVSGGDAVRVSAGPRTRTSAVSLRLLSAIVVFAIVALLLVATIGNFSDPATAANTFPLVVCAALALAGCTYAGVEYAQTGRIASLARQFDTRTLTLMPAAIAINIVVGSAVANALKVPVYLDSLGTVLVGVLAGPVPGLLTGVLSNVLWQYVVPPPFQGATSAAFSLTAATIGLIAGLMGWLGVMRPRRATNTARLLAGGTVAIVLVAALVAASFANFYVTDLNLFTGDPVSPALLVLGWVVLLGMLAAAVGLLISLLVRRDLGIAYVVVAGALTGFVSATISAPVASSLYGGVTGGGTDFLVAFFRTQGAGVLAATFEQSLLSDPIDKITTFLVVYLVLQGVSRRVLAGFPQGERLLPPAN